VCSFLPSKNPIMHKYLFFFILLLNASCSPSRLLKVKKKDIGSPKENHPATYARHVIEIDKNGEHINRKLYDSITLGRDEHFRAILSGIDDHIRKNGKKKLLIFFHGGLNSISNSLERGLTKAPVILKEDEMYSVFVNWDSGPFSSYGQHLFIKSSGVSYTDTKWPFAPLTLASDLVTGMARSPISGFNNLSSYFYSLTFVPSRRNSTALYGELCDRMHKDPDNEISVRWGESQRKKHRSFLRGSYSFAMSWSRLIGGFVFWDGLGTPAWMNMKGRAYGVFHPGSEFDIRKYRYDTERVQERLDTDHSGVLSQFMDTLLQQLQGYDKAGLKYELTVIGHSMGAIITNNLLREYPELEVKNIVHMAGASSIREVKNCIVPYLQTHKNTNYYNLTLHPKAEVRESLCNIEFLVPRGTLLVHIDNTFERPFSFMDRTSGRWENVIQATHLFPDSIRGRVTIKSFDILNTQPYNDKKNKGSREERLRKFIPQKHGNFGKGPFWDERFWKITDPLPYCGQQAK
jgi:pimeloyl-ACP methyl ester carboxylesterase